AAMAYFREFAEGYYLAGGQQAVSDRPIVGTMCVMVPDELILAAGAVPLRLCCGASACEQAGAEFMPAKSCPLIKATNGYLSVHRGSLPQKISAIVIPSTCDQKKKSAELLRAMGYRVILLEMPPTADSENGRHYWRQSVKGLVPLLEKLTGQKITRARLQQAIGLVSAASQAFREIQQLRKEQPGLLSGSELLLVNSIYFIDRIESWTVAVQGLRDELRQRLDCLDKGSRRLVPHLLLTGSPPIFPNFKVPLLIEQAGALIAADELCSSARLLHDTVVYDEANLYEMIPAVADRYLKSSTCPCLTPNDNRLRKILALVRENHLDGVVYQAFSGCLPYELEQKGIADSLAEIGIPMLYVETDYSPEDAGQLTTRVEAFVESIKTRKKAGGAGSHRPQGRMKKSAPDFARQRITAINQSPQEWS
ncbi:MAG TPA: 2-hydroxyacyl-CoA dehydratase family protein, partial [Desulfurivibrionaceae bacterium]|nr:2-hydroxyacyl-CoA dehydratase family protein [Desulfurivibrionaceae bacterium]